MNMTMKNRILIISLLMLCLSISSFSQVEPIRLNSLGYLPDQSKIASVVPTIKSFKVIAAETGKVVFTGQTSDAVSQADVAQTVRIANFSKVKAAGTYYIQANDSLKSPVFSIGKNVYNQALTTSFRAFYLWRCGTAVEGDYNGIHYSHAACHTEDGWLDSIGYLNKQKDGIGGWHDAGDHGKYVVNAGVTVGMMFMAWEQFNDKLKDAKFNLPETAPGYPDFLKELKWETDWLLKMTYPDGSGRISHKLTRTTFEGFVMPEDDTEKRYFTNWSSAATADFVAMMAQAARYFKPYDAVYAQKCLEAATASYAFLVANPTPQPFRQRFRTGGYGSPDDDDRLWAAAEMWETTGNVECLKDFETRLSAMEVKVNEDWDWGNVRNMGVFTYLLSKRKGKNPALFAEVKKRTIEVADMIVEKGQKDIFQRPLGSKYYWGCNGTVVRQVLNLQVANKIKPDKRYIQTSLDAISNIFGRNQYGRSFVTGLGYKPPMNPHCRRSGGDTIKEPWPGYIVGGGNKATDWKDEEASFSTNEIAINWQAALVYALAGFVLPLK
jgi:endoglucanase